jgi:hypothetical protein
MNNYPHLSKLANHGETLAKFKKIMGGDTKAPIGAVTGEQPPPTIISEATKKIKERSGQPAQPEPPPTQPAALAATPQPQSKEVTAMHEAGHKDNKCKCGGVCATCRAAAGSKDNMRVVGPAMKVKTVPHEATGDQAWKDMQDKIASAYPALAKQAAGVIAPPTSLLDTIKNVILKNPTTAATVGGGAFGGITNLLRGRGVLRGMGTGAITGLGSVLGSNVGTAAGSLIGSAAPDAFGVERMSMKPDEFGFGAAFDGAVDAGAGLGGGAVGAIGGAGFGGYGGYQLAQRLFGDEDDGKNPRERKEEGPVPGDPEFEAQLREFLESRNMISDPKTASSYPGGFQKEAVALSAAAGMGIGGIVNLLRGRSVLRGMTTGGLTGAGLGLGSGLGAEAGAAISGDPLGNTTVAGVAGGGVAGSVGGYALAQKLHDAISGDKDKDKDEDKMREMLAQYKQSAAMYPALTKQAFESPAQQQPAVSAAGGRDRYQTQPQTAVGRGPEYSGQTHIDQFDDAPKPSPAPGDIRKGLFGGGLEGGLSKFQRETKQPKISPQLTPQQLRTSLVGGVGGVGGEHTLKGLMNALQPPRAPGAGLGSGGMIGVSGLTQPYAPAQSTDPTYRRQHGLIPHDGKDPDDPSLRPQQSTDPTSPLMKQNMAMYPALTKQAFEMPESISDAWSGIKDYLSKNTGGISDAWSGIKDYFKNNPDAMNALIGAGVGAGFGGLGGYLKADKNESSIGDIFGHALAGATVGGGLGYGARSLGGMVSNSDLYKNLQRKPSVGTSPLPIGGDTPAYVPKPFKAPDMWSGSRSLPLSWQQHKYLA